MVVLSTSIIRCLIHILAVRLPRIRAHQRKGAYHRCWAAGASAQCAAQILTQNHIIISLILNLITLLHPYLQAAKGWGAPHTKGGGRSTAVGLLHAGGGPFNFLLQLTRFPFLHISTSSPAGFQGLGRTKGGGRAIAAGLLDAAGGAFDFHHWNIHTFPHPLFQAAKDWGAPKEGGVPPLLGCWMQMVVLAWEVGSSALLARVDAAMRASLATSASSLQVRSHRRICRGKVLMMQEKVLVM